MKKPMKHKTALIITISIVSFLAVILIVVYGVFSHFFNLSNYTRDHDSISLVHVSDEETLGATAAESVKEEIEIANGRRERLLPVAEKVHPFITSWAHARKIEEEEWQEAVAAAKPLANEEGLYNLLLIGVDRRSDDEDDTWYGNSDSMILVTLNYHTGKVILTSLMRDLCVDVPGVGIRKLNSAYANGGAQLLVMTLQENFGLAVDSYAEVNFSGLIECIDAIGGVDVEISKAEAERYKLDISEDTAVVHMDGKLALRHARNRTTGSDADFGRTERQREVLLAVVEKARSGGLGDLKKAAEKLLPYITHNMEQSALVSLILDLPKLVDFTFVSERIPYDGLFVMNDEFLVPDYKKTIEKYKKVISE